MIFSHVAEHDPIATGIFYAVAMLVLFATLAALADWLDARARRRARDQARAAMRAKRTEERELSGI